jgi:hypothetical protein
LVNFFKNFFKYVLCFWPGPASVCNPPTYASCVAGIIGMSHHTSLVLLRWDLAIRPSSQFPPPTHLGLQTCATLPRIWDYRRATLQW